MSIGGRLIDAEIERNQKEILEAARAARKMRGTDSQLPEIYHYKMENEVMKLLCSYMKTKVSLKELTFQLPGELRQYQFTCPVRNN